MQNPITNSRRIASCAFVIVLLAMAAPTVAQTADDFNPLRSSNSESDPLTTKQARLADRYDQLEMLAGRLAELSRATQPRRARLLRELVAKSRERDIPGRFSLIVEALQVESLGKASSAQGELQGDLQTLLDLLLQEDRDKQIDSERKRIRKYLAELKQLIQRQRGIKARTDGGDDADSLNDDQKRLADSTESLEKEITANELSSEDSESNTKESSNDNKGVSKPQEGSEQKDSQDDGEKDSGDQKGSQAEQSQKDSGKESPSGSEQPAEQQDAEGQQSQDGKPSESQPSESQPGQPSEGQPTEGQPSQGQSQPVEQSDEPSEQSQSPAKRAQQRLQRAQQRMQRALEELEKANRNNAVKRQEEALRELEQAKAELERILRQLREEERERMLVLLEARFRKMLDAQTIVYEQTKKLNKSRESVPEHEVEIASGRLSRQEREIVREADRCLVLLREDGTTVAFPEAVEQARDDMISVQERLSEVKTALITQGLEEDIITALEEAIAALQQAIKKARAQKGQPQQQSSGSPGEEDLVDQLEELRMIRALQNRVNRRTQRYGEIIGDQITADPDLLEALDQLALRQERIFQATRDLDTGRNK